MTEYIFRGKRVDNGEWIYGSLSWFTDGSPIEITMVERPKGNDKWTRVVAPETVGQYSGLCDKNGNKIWEGDIVKNEFGEIAKVRFVFGRYTPFNVYPEYRCFNSDLCEVIGNIHDNPELLKER